jgi:hypothetical protein
VRRSPLAAPHSPRANDAVNGSRRHALALPAANGQAAVAHRRRDAAMPWAPPAHTRLCRHRRGADPRYSASNPPLGMCDGGPGEAVDRSFIGVAGTTHKQDRAGRERLWRTNPNIASKGPTTAAPESGADSIGLPSRTPGQSAVNRDSMHPNTVTTSAAAIASTDMSGNIARIHLAQCTTCPRSSPLRTDAPTLAAFFLRRASSIRG